MADYGILRAKVLRRFEGHDYVPGGPLVFVWHVHHGKLLGPLIAPIEERIDYIIDQKEDHEIVTRLDWLRPVMCELPEVFVKAWAEWDRAWAEWDRARAELDRAWAEWDRARAEWSRASAEWSRAWAELDRARAECSEELEAIHVRELSGCPWDGTQMVFDAANAAEG